MHLKDQKEFSVRLLEVMETNGFAASPTKLARAFNLVSGEPPISVHAARKWLVGEAIPTNGKLQTLAAMLGADPQWLRFGSGVKKVVLPEISPEQNAMLVAYSKLTPRHQKAVYSLTVQLGGGV